MKLHQLRALDAVARLGGIRAAAREMGLTQPALTKAQKSRRKKRSLTWNPRVVTRVELCHDNSASRTS